jgi:hypothetical protein
MVILGIVLYSDNGLFCTNISHLTILRVVLIDVVCTELFFYREADRRRALGIVVGCYATMMAVSHVVSFILSSRMSA